MSNSDDPHGFKRPPSINGKTGYKNPPRHHRFPKGTSGNLNGRPRKKKDMDMFEMMLKELQKEITILENGIQKKVTKREALVKRTVAMALEGDKKAMEFIRKLDEALFEERVRKEEPQGGVLIVGPVGLPTEEGWAKGYRTLEEEMYAHQAQYRNSQISPKDEEGDKK